MTTPKKQESKKPDKSPPVNLSEIPTLEQSSEQKQLLPDFSRFVVLRTALLFVSVVGILAGIKVASGILTPVLLALFITIILLAPLHWLHGKGVPSFLSFLIVSGAILLLFTGFVWLLGNSISDFSNRLPKYTVTITEKIEKLDQFLRKFGWTMFPAPKNDDELKYKQQLTEKINELDQRLQEFGFPISPVRENSEESKPDQIVGDIVANENQNFVTEKTEAEPLPALSGSTDAAVVKKTVVAEKTPSPSAEITEINVKQIMVWIAWGAAGLRRLAENAFLILVVLMFMLFEAARFPAKLEKAFGGSDITNEHFRNIVDDIRRYVFYKGAINLLSCSIVLTFYYFLGVQYALLWVLIAFFLYYIPNIGTPLAAILPVLLTFVDQGIGTTVILIAGLCVIESVIGFGLEPRLLGHSLGIATIVVFLSMVFWGWLLGPAGLFLAAPLTIVSKIALQAFEETRWLAILLGK
ncbi:MAG: AI-2E family transporter [Planctomycetaceae bacterium]|nr:AI-2E family transporter [Planctomycetaceae bacterium]